MTTDIHFIEAGNGDPLLLLHGGLLSSDPLWAGHPAAYATYVDQLAAQFRVIAVDTRGHGKTQNTSGRVLTYAELADDVIGLIDTLRLDRPMICGFSDGGAIANVVGIRAPKAVRAIATHGGIDVLDPGAKHVPMARGYFGGRPDATSADPDAFARVAAADPNGLLDRMKRAHGDSWRSVVQQLFHRLVTPEYTFEDLRSIAVPTLVLCGDRDFLCPPENAVQAYRALGANGELAIVPGLGHELSRAAIALTIEFLQRHRS